MSNVGNCQQPVSQLCNQDPTVLAALSTTPSCARSQRAARLRVRLRKIEKGCGSMSESGWPAENWAALGDAIAKARRAKGWDQQELANLSSNSANTISNYERGRPSQSRRVPGGYIRVAHALGWSPDSPQLILAGEDPEVVLDRPSLFDLTRHGSEGVRKEPRTAVVGDMPREDVARISTPGLMGSREIELVESGHLAQDVFLRQAKRYRQLRGVSVEELAEKFIDLGFGLSAQDVRRLESGTRLLAMAEAKAIASALETTVDWLLGSGFSDEAPEEMRRPPNDKELEAEANAVMRRMGEVGAQLNAARQQAEFAREREAAARAEAEMAMVMVQSVAAKQGQMEKHYQYLLGRIDSIRAARGEETAIQLYPVYEDDGQ